MRERRRWSRKAPETLTESEYALFAYVPPPTGGSKRTVFDGPFGTSVTATGTFVNDADACDILMDRLEAMTTYLFDPEIEPVMIAARRRDDDPAKLIYIIRRTYSAILSRLTPPIWMRL